MTLGLREANPARGKCCRGQSHRVRRPREEKGQRGRLGLRHGGTTGAARFLTMRTFPNQDFPLDDVALAGALALGDIGDPAIISGSRQRDPIGGGPLCATPAWVGAYELVRKGR